eukprot:Colp12_sorted_trinity150504_noHs@9085
MNVVHQARRWLTAQAATGQPIQRLLSGSPKRQNVVRFSLNGSSNSYNAGAEGSSFELPSAGLLVLGLLSGGLTGRSLRRAFQDKDRDANEECTGKRLAILLFDALRRHMRPTQFNAFANSFVTQTGINSVVSANEISSSTSRSQSGSSSSSSSLEDTLHEFEEEVSRCSGQTSNSLAIAHVRQMQDWDGAAQLFMEGAESNYARAQFNLGLCYEQGKGVPKDIHIAAEHYARAAKQGHSKAQFQIAMLLAQGLLETKNPWPKALKLLELAASKGLNNAQTYLGLCYLYGSGVEQQPSKGLALLSAAAEQNDPVALYSLGTLHESGTVVSKDLAHAAFLYERAAALGHSDAAYNLAVFYENGTGVRARSATQAAKWYKKAARLGNRDAMYNLGVMYAYGAPGVQADCERAVRYLKGAASLGDFEAQEELTKVLAKCNPMAPQ